MNSIFSAVGIKLYKIAHEQKHRLETLCGSMVASGFDDASEVKKQADEIKTFISLVAPVCEDVELELSEINQGSSSRCFEAKVDGIRQKIVKQFFPNDLFRAGLLEQVRLEHVPNGTFWWIKDDASIGARNSFLKRFIRYICQSDEIKHAQATDEELGKAMLYEPELKFSSIGFIYDAPRFNGKTLAQEFALSDCDSVDEIKNRIRLIIKAAQNIKSYCHDAGIFHGDIKPQNIFNINLKNNDCVVRNIDFDTWLSRDKLARGYLDLLATTRDYYFYDSARIAESTPIEDLWVYDVRALANMLIYALSGNSKDVDNKIAQYKESRGRLDWLDFFLTGRDGQLSPMEKIYDTLNRVPDRALSHLLILDKLKTLLFVCSSHTNFAWIEFYTRKSKIDIDYFITQLTDIEKLLELYSNNYSMEIKGDALRYMNLVYLDRENLRFKRKIDINLRALSRQWARSWITTVIEKNYYCNVTSATNDFAIDRQLLPDIKRTLSSDVFSRFDRVLSSNRGADDNSRNRYKDIEINSLSPLLIAMYCIDKSLYLTAEGGQGKTAMMRSVWLDYMSGRSIVPCVYVELGLLKKSDKEAIKSYIANEYRIPDLDKLSKDIVLLLDGANETIEEFRDVVDGEDGCRLVKECKALISANKKIVIGSRSDVIRGGETVGNKKEFDDKDEMIYMSVAPLRDKQIEHCLKNKFAAVKNKRPLIDLLRNNMMLHIYNRLGLYGIKIARKNMSSGKLLYMYFHVCFKTRYIRNTLHDEVGDLSDAQLYEVIREIEPPDEVGDLTDVQLYEEKREIEPRKKLSKRVEQRISDELERYNKIVVFLRDNCFGDIKELRDDILPEAFESLSIMSKVDGVYRWKHENFEEYFQAVKLNKMLDELKCGDSNKLCDNYLFNVWKHENFEEYFQATESDEMLDKLKCGYGNQLVDNYLSKFGYLCASPNKHKYNVLKFASDIKSFEEQFYYELYKMVYPKDAERLTGLVSVAELFLLLAVIATGNIPDGVKRIYSTFDSCEVIERVIIPDSVKSIDIELFKKCRNLKELELPRAMKFPPCHMLYGCDRLRDITFRARNGKITKRKKEEVFYDCVCKIIDNKAYKKIRSYKKDDSKAIAFENVCMDTIEAIMALSSEHTRQDSIKIAKEWVRFANKDYKQEHNEMYKYRVSIFDRVRREFIIATDAEYLLLQNQLYDRYDKKNR